MNCQADNAKGWQFVRWSTIPPLYCDEPTGNLDSKTSIDIMNLFEDIYKQGNTIIVVTHEEDIARHAQDCAAARWINRIDEINPNPDQTGSYHFRIVLWFKIPYYREDIHKTGDRKYLLNRRDRVPSTICALRRMGQ